jgi:Flp pilus assembly pilin Flp
MTGDSGATAVEYALMVGFIAVVIAAGVTAFGLGVQSLFASVPAGL